MLKPDCFAMRSVQICNPPHGRAGGRIAGCKLTCFDKDCIERINPLPEVGIVYGFPWSSRRGGYLFAEHTDPVFPAEATVLVQPQNEREGLCLPRCVECPLVLVPNDFGQRCFRIFLHRSFSLLTASRW